jgi:hypothetical protein
MKNSALFSTSFIQFVESLGYGFVGALVTGLYQLMTAGTILTWTTEKPIIIGAVIMCLGRIIKTYFSNIDGQFAKQDPQLPEVEKQA